MRLPDLLLIAMLLHAVVGASHASAADTAPGAPAADGIIPATPLIKLEKMEVTGSRLDFGGAGPSPVTIYDSEQIRATGAFTLADFLSHIPQVYNGVGAGRNSTPNELNPEFGQRTESTLPAFNFVMGSAAASPGQTGVSGVSLRGLGAGSTLVLVDGRRVAHSGMGNRSTDSRQDFVNINNIPLGMIERIEIITDSASAIHGADAVAGVVNIITKKNYTGTTVSLNSTVARHGGGGERAFNITSGFTKGRLRGMLGLDYFRRDALKASERDFSRDQNRSTRILGHDAAGQPVYGTDFRLNWGYPAIVQSRVPNPASATFVPLDGITDPAGNPTGIAAVNDGSAGAGLSSFTGLAATAASRARRADTAEFLDLIPFSERQGLHATLTYSLTPDTELRASYRHAQSRNHFSSQPAVSSASLTTGFGAYSTLVPAAYNPFGQDVAVGLVHYEFGPITQKTDTTAHDLLLAATGKFNATWQWDAGLNYQRQDYAEVTRNFNAPGITAALANPDPARRLNPFIDARAPGAPSQAAIYETLAYYNHANSESDSLSIDFNASGELARLWGGAATAALGLAGDYSDSRRNSINNDPSQPAAPIAQDSGSHRGTYSGYGELALPIFGKQNARPLLQSLVLHLAARYEYRDKVGGSGLIPKAGFTWSPGHGVLLRGSYSKGYRAPHLTEYQTAETTSQGYITDLARNNESYYATVTRGSNPRIKAETSDSYSYGIIYQPDALKGLRLSATCYEVATDGAIQMLGAQTLVNNEPLFPDRVTREPLTPADEAAGHTAGKITSVNTTFRNFGKTIRRSLDLSADYELPWRNLGRWRLITNANHLLRSRRELAPGQPAIIEDGDTFAPARWRLHGTLYWNRKAWSASFHGEYQSSFKTNQAGNSLDNSTAIVTTRIPGFWSFDARANYEFQANFIPNFGKGLRLTLGVVNLLDQKPPHSNTVYGYNAGVSNLALGRSLQFGIELPF